MIIIDRLVETALMVLGFYLFLSVLMVNIFVFPSEVIKFYNYYIKRNTSFLDPILREHIDRFIVKVIPLKDAYLNYTLITVFVFLYWFLNAESITEKSILLALCIVFIIGMSVIFYRFKIVKRYILENDPYYFADKELDDFFDRIKKSANSKIEDYNDDVLENNK